MTALFDALIADPWASWRFLVTIFPLNPATGLIETYQYSTHGFTAADSDSLADPYFPERMVPPIVKRSMFQGSGIIGGRSIPDYGELVLWNGDGGVDFLKDYALDGQRIWIRFGGVLSNGTALAYSDYATIFDGTSSGSLLAWEQEAHVVLKSNDFKLDKPVQANLYTAQCPESVTTGDKVTVSTFPQQTGSLTVEGWYYIPDATTPNQRFLGTDDGTNGWEVGMGAAGIAQFITRALSTQSLSSSAGALVVGWNHIAVVYDHAGQVKTILINGASVGSVSSLTGSLAASTGALTLFTTPGLAGGVAMTAPGRIAGLRIWNVARSAAQIKANQRVRLLGTETGLVGYWPGWATGDGTGTVLHDQTSGGHNGAFTGCDWTTADWVDPGVAGAPLPLLYGERLNLKPALPDPPSLIYQIHDRGIQQVKRVRVSGSPLTPPFSYAGTDIAFTAPNLISAAGADFSVLLGPQIGQPTTANESGQQFTVAGSAQGANNATWTVASTSADGHTITVTGSTIATSGAGSSVTVVAVGGQPEFSVDLTRGLVTLNVNPSGKVSIWAKGDNVGGYVSTWADIDRRVMTRHGGLLDPSQLDTGAFTAANSANSGVCGVYLDKETNLLQLGDQIANTCGGAHGFERSALYQIFQVLAPSGAPDLSVDKTVVLSPFAAPIAGSSSASSAGSTVTGVGTGASAVSPIEPVALELPCWRVVVQYAENDVILGAQEVAGNVTTNPAAYSFMTQQWRQAVAQDPSILATFPLAITLTVQALFVNQADAQAEANRLLALYKVKRQMWKIPLRGQPYAVDVNKQIQVTLPRFGMSAGWLGRIVEFDEQTTPGMVVVTAWG